MAYPLPASLSPPSGTSFRAVLAFAVLGSISTSSCGSAMSPARSSYRDPTVGASVGAAASSPRALEMTGVAIEGGGAVLWHFEGLAGGPVSAEAIDGSCRGWLPNAPQFQFDLPSSRSIAIGATSNVDATLVMYGPSGDIHCNDDTNGLNPEVSGTFGPGHYRVFIGTYSQGESDTFYGEVRTF